MEMQNEIKHIAFIMDGNGRWAKKRMMPREYGHTFGAKKFKEVASHCYELGIPNVTFYAFSTENWKRPAQEVNAIMKLFMKNLKKNPENTIILKSSIFPITRKSFLTISALKAGRKS